VRERPAVEGFSDRAPSLPPIRPRFDDEPERERAPARRPPPRNRALPITLLIVFLVGGATLALFGFGVYVGIRKAKRAAAVAALAATPMPTVPGDYYEDWVRRRGVPEAYAHISENQACLDGFSARVTRRNGRIEKIEYVNGRFDPSGNAAPEEYLFLYYSPPFARRHESWFQFDYDEKGQIRAEHAFGRDGFHLWTLRYSSPTDATYLDKFSNPVAPPWLGSAYVSFIWSPEGWEQEVILKNAEGKITPDAEGIARIRKKHDERGFLTEQTFHDASGKPVISRQRGYAGFRTRYDEHIRVSFVTALGADGRQKKLYSGFATVRIDYAVAGVRYSYLDENDKPVRLHLGYASVQRRYNNHGNLESEEYFAADGTPTAIEGVYFGWQVKYDAQGHQIEKVYQGRDGRPIMIDAGYAIERREFDDQGRLSEESFFDTQRRPCACEGGYARTESLYDENGHASACWYFGADGKPVLVNGFAGWRAKNAPDGRRLETSYYGSDGKLRMQDDGWAKIVNEYDDEGRLTTTSYFDADEKPAKLPGGYAKMTHKYDAKDRICETAYFGPDGKPTLGELGSAITRFKHDDGGRVVETVYFGVDGKPCLCPEGYSKFTMRYGPHKYVAEEWACFGVDGKPCRCKSGYGKMTTRFEKDRVVETAWFDADDKPILVDGKARITHKHDDQRRVIETRYLGIKAELVAQPGGMARTTFKHDEKGYVIEEAYFDPQGKLANSASGYSRVTRKYEGEYQIVEEAYFSPDGKPVGCKAGYARWTRTQTPGDSPQTVYYDAAGKSVTVRARVVSIEGDQIADKAGLKSGDVLIAYDGKPIEGTSSYYALQGKDRGAGPHPLIVERNGQRVQLKIKLARLEIGLEDFAPAGDGTKN
jgi:hypothetical protein